MAQTVRFVDTVSYTEADQADFNMRTMRPQGVIPESTLGTLIVSAIGSMSVRVGAGEAFIQGFQYINDANVDLLIGANSSGSTRVDYVILRLNRTANTLVLAVLAGIAGAGAPALTQVSGGTWEFPLAQITVPNNASSIVAGNIADSRVLSRWALVALDPAMATDAEITAAVSAETTARTNADTTLQTNITSEATTRASADTTLTTNLNAEITNRGTAVSGEATARTNADTTLQNNITSEASTRGTADTNLNTAISTETTNRTNADTTLTNANTALSTRVTTLEGALRVRAAGVASGSGGLFYSNGCSSMTRQAIGSYLVNLSFTMPSTSYFVVATCNNFNRMIGVAIVSATQFSVSTSATPAGGGNYVQADENFQFAVFYT